MTEHVRGKQIEDCIGMQMVTEDVITAAHVQKLAVTLDSNLPMPEEGDPVPPGWHHIFFPRLALTRDLGADGMVPEVDGGPDDPLPLRMFAGSKARYHESLLVGDKITQERTLTAVSRKEGRHGKMVFATYGHKIYGSSGLCIEDDWNLVFLEDDPDGHRPPPPAIPAPGEVDWDSEINVSETQLFRFSAVTFNPHRIHYDHAYTTGVEGYPGLVVHGPLTAILLHELARQNMPGRQMAAFSMSARAPLFANQNIRLVGKATEAGTGCDLFALTPQGNVAMQANATFR